MSEALEIFRGHEWDLRQEVAGQMIEVQVSRPATPEISGHWLINMFMQGGLAEMGPIEPVPSESYPRLMSLERQQRIIYEATLSHLYYGLWTSEVERLAYARFGDSLGSTWLRIGSRLIADHHLHVEHPRLVTHPLDSVMMGLSTYGRHQFQPWQQAELYSHLVWSYAERGVAFKNHPAEISWQPAWQAQARLFRVYALAQQLRSDETRKPYFSWRVVAQLRQDVNFVLKEGELGQSGHSCLRDNLGDLLGDDWVEKELPELI